MSKVEARKGIFVELPDEWLSLGSTGPLLAVCDAYTASWLPNPDPHELWRGRHGWGSLLFDLVREQTIELSGRQLRPAAPLVLIDIYPPSELHSDNFDIEGCRVIHLPSGRVHYDVHYRVRRPGRGALAAPSAVASSGSPPAPPQASLGDAASRPRMIHAIWAAARYPPWTWRLAWEQARAAYPGSPLFAECSRSLKKHSWTDARKLRR